MNVFAKFDEIPSKILKVIKVKKRNGHTHTHTHTHGRKDGQPENSIPTHKHSLRGVNMNEFDEIHSMTLQDIEEICTYKSH